MSKKQEIIKEFENRFVSTGARIEGMNRVEYEHINTKNVSTIICWLEDSLDSYAEAYAKELQIADDRWIRAEEHHHDKHEDEFGCTSNIENK